MSETSHRPGRFSVGAPRHVLLLAQNLHSFTPPAAEYRTVWPVVQGIGRAGRRTGAARPTLFSLASKLQHSLARPDAGYLLPCDGLASVPGGLHPDPPAGHTDSSGDGQRREVDRAGCVPERPGPFYYPRHRGFSGAAGVPGLLLV